MSISGLPWGKPGGSGGGGPGPVTQDFGVYLPEEYGAKGDGTTDDLVALQRFEAARLAGNGLGLLRRVYAVSAPLMLAGGVRWTGYGTTSGKSRIVALEPMAAPVIIANASAPVVPNDISWMTFDAARLANVAILERGNAGARFTRCNFVNGLLDGERTANVAGTAIVLGAVTQTGPGPALSVSILDPAFCMPIGTHLFMKVFIPGGDGVGAIGVSTDGVTYDPSRQVLFATNQLGFPGGPSTYITSTGIGLQKAAGNLVLNTVYDFTITVVPAENDNIVFDACTADQCGVIYTTAGLAGDYLSPTFNQSTVLGTVSTTAGDPVLRFTGASLLSLGLRDGDTIRIPGLHVTLPTGGTAQQRLKVAVVLNDNTCVVDWTFPPNNTLTNVGFAVSRGAGFWEDTLTGSQANKMLIAPRVTGSATCHRVGGLSGQKLITPYSRNYAITNFSVGTAHAD